MGFEKKFIFSLFSKNNKGLNKLSIMRFEEKIFNIEEFFAFSKEQILINTIVNYLIKQSPVLSTV